MNAHTVENAGWSIVSVIGLAAWIGFGVAWQRGFRPFGPQRIRAVPWGPFDVLMLAPLIVASVIRGVAAATHAAVESHAEWLVSLEQLGLVSALFLPIALLLVRGARPYQLGLHCSHWRRNAALGCGSYLLAAPIVAAAMGLASYWFDSLPHDIEKQLRESLTPGKVASTAFSAVLFAPVLEELLFRGILMPWLRKVAGVWPAILGSSFVFAAMHATAWPAPIPLFFLALFLGVLAHRTTSLVAPIALHATFNGVSLAMLVVSIVLDPTAT